jgi:hypothetical protein
MVLKSQPVSLKAEDFNSTVRKAADSGFNDIAALAEIYTNSYKTATTTRTDGLS